MRLLVAISLCFLAAVVVNADGLNVLAKLGPGVCNSTTGFISDNALLQLKQQAALQGLVYLYPLATRCWHVFQQAPSKEGTIAAIASLSTSGAAGVQTASTSLPMSGLGLFEVARVDRPILVPKPIITDTTDSPNTTIDVSGAMVTNSSTGNVLSPSAVPDECSGGVCSKLWGMNRINVASLWQIPGLMPFTAFPKKGTVIDTGVDYAHADLVGQVNKSISATFNVLANNQPPQGATNTNLPSTGATGHGTHVTGTAAGGWGNGDTRGIAGVVGPSSAGVVSCNAFTPGSYFNPPLSDVGATSQDLVNCYSHAATVDAHWVINLSLGGPGTASDFSLDGDALKQHICDNGGIVVVAAGNDALNIQAAGYDSSGYRYDGQYPAKFAATYPDCFIAVAAIDSQDRLADFSNYGPAVSIAAPGVAILSDMATRFSDQTTPVPWRSATWSGTSMATPHVFGAALLLRNAFPAATGPQVVRCLKSTATQPVKPASNDPNGLKTIGGGILNVAAAYECLKTQLSGQPSPSPPPGVSASPSPQPVASPAPGIQPHPSPSPSPSPSPPPTPSACPDTGLPECVEASSGSVLAASARCARTDYCVTVRAASPRYTCRYSYKAAGSVCRVGGVCELDALCRGGSGTCPRNAAVRNCIASGAAPARG